MIFKNQWNEHHISTEHNQSPKQLFFSGMILHGVRGITEEIPLVSSEIMINENEYGVDWDGPSNSNDNENLNFSNIPCPLNNEQYNELQNAVLPLEQSNNYGIEIYLHALSVVQFLLSENN